MKKIDLDFETKMNKLSMYIDLDKSKFDFSMAVYFLVGKMLKESQFGIELKNPADDCYFSVKNINLSTLNKDKEKGDFCVINSPYLDNLVATFSVLNNLESLHGISAQDKICLQAYKELFCKCVVESKSEASRRMTPTEMAVMFKNDVKTAIGKNSADKSLDK